MEPMDLMVKCKDGKDGKDGEIPQHEYAKGQLRFQVSPDKWGEWINLKRMVQMITPKSSMDSGLGGGGSNLDFFVGDKFYRDIKYLNIDQQSLIVSRNGDVLTLGINPNILTPSGLSYTFDYFKLNIDNEYDFLLTHIPLSNSEVVIMNGIVLTEGLDYTLIGMMISIDSRHQTKKDWNLTVKYAYV